MDYETKLAKARTRLLMEFPFFGNLILSMGLIHDEKKTEPFKTMCIDGVNIYYSKDFVDKLTVEEVKGVLMHEVHHVALFHLKRKGAHKNHQVWNMACDLAINWMIAEYPKCSLPEGALLDHKYRDWTAEKIYDDIMQDVEKEVQRLGGRVDENGNVEFPEDSFVDVHGEMTEQEERKMMQKMTAIYDAIPEKSRGTVPGALERLINAYKNPRIPWEKFFQGVAIDIFSRVDYSWEALSNQYRVIMPDMAFPKMCGTKNKILAICVDTSGSIGPREIEMFTPEVDKICKMADKTIVMSCDAEVHEVIETSTFSDALKQIKFLGGGGTSFVPPFEELRKRRIVPECFIYFTDAYGDFPNRPNFPVIWCLTENNAGHVPFGIKIEMRDYYKND